MCFQIGYTDFKVVKIRPQLKDILKILQNWNVFFSDCIDATGSMQCNGAMFILTSFMESSDNCSGKWTSKLYWVNICSAIHISVSKADLFDQLKSAPFSCYI